MKLNLIKEARLAKGYSQENVAMDIGLSQSQYSRRENGSIVFSLEEIRMLCYILDLDIHDTVVGLIDILPDKQEDNFDNEAESTPEQILNDLDKLHRWHLIYYIDFMLTKSHIFYMKRDPYPIIGGII